jgi:hypothetical protein
MADTDNRSGRETRLLGLVIVVALAALLVLARFRFPAADIASVTPAQGPLERLAARSTYEDLAASVANLVQRVTPSVIVFELQSAPAPQMPEGKEAAAPPTPPVSRLLGGLRVGGDLALVHVPDGLQPVAGQGLAATIELVAHDTARQIALVRAPSILDIANGLTNAVEAFDGFSFVAAVEAAIGGVTARPIFIGRVDPTSDARWAAPILVVGGNLGIPSGAIVFTLDARLIGLTVPFDDHRQAIVPAAALAPLVKQLQIPRETAADETPPGGRGRGGRP